MDGSCELRQIVYKIGGQPSLVEEALQHVEKYIFFITFQDLSTMLIVIIVKVIKLLGHQNG